MNIDYIKNLEPFDIPSYDDGYSIDDEVEQEEEIEFYTEKVGPAPLDYLIVAQTVVIRPPLVKPVYVLCWCHPETLEYYVSDFPVLKNGELLPQEERQYPREDYTEIEQAGKSDYFKALFRVDKAVDKKIEEIKRHELDTRYAPHGLRIGASWQKTYTLYGEAFNRTQPEHQEYVQVVSQNGEYIYTASHTSYARQYELGEIYEHYFDKPPRQEYYVRINKLKQLSPKYSYFALPFKMLQHQMMNELLEVGIPLYETRDKELPYDPVLTSVRSAPEKNEEGELAEATIDVNSYQRVYVIAVNTQGKDSVFVSSRSLYQEAMPDMYHAFDFDWPNVILKQFNTRNEAQNDTVYGHIFSCLFKLMEGVRETKKPYVWRKGCTDLYGFDGIEFGEGIGAEQNREKMSKNKPSNLRIMMQPHPSTRFVL